MNHINVFVLIIFLSMISVGLMFMIETLIIWITKKKVVNTNIPKVICISGSMRYLSLMYEVAALLTLENSIVLMPFVDSRDKKFVGIGFSKEILYRLHNRKMDMCDELFIVNPCDYIGESTHREILYAMAHNKKLRYYYGSYIESIIERRSW